jgi:GAF domain-containing protein
VEARQRLNDWLTLNDTAPSRKAPKLTFDRVSGPGLGSKSPGNGASEPRSISLEGEAGAAGIQGRPPVSTSIQYEFNSLGSDLNTALRVISERARTLLRGTGAAIAIVDRSPMMCRASVGTGGPPLGTHVDVNSGFSGECIRTGKTLRCDDAETDSRVEAATCRKLGVRSIVAAPIRYEREVVGVLEVFSAQSFAFDEGDLAVLERLAQTVLLMVRHTQPFRRG